MVPQRLDGDGGARFARRARARSQGAPLLGSGGPSALRPGQPDESLLEMNNLVEVESWEHVVEMRL